MKTNSLKLMSLLLITACSFFSCQKQDMEILPKHYIINFMGEGVDIEAQSIPHGSHVMLPENPERESYNFDGWFTDNGTFVNKWDFGVDIVTQDTTLYAKWEESTFQEANLQGTEWKLVGIGSLDKIALQELEPKDCTQCYTLSFDTDSTAIGWSTSNMLGVTLKPVLRVFLMTEALGTDFYLEDAILFCNAIETITSYELCKNELKFYYNGGKNYLQYKEIGSNNEK